MPNHGIIYQASTLAKRVLYHLVRGFGAGLIAFAFIGIIFSFWPIAKEEFLYKFGTQEQIQIDKFAQIIGKSQAKSLGLDPYFSLYIPKIDAKAKVIANVNPGKAVDYLNALSDGVAHAQGTNFPGQG